MAFSIRPATREDCRDLVRMVRELAEHFKFTDCATQADLEQNGFTEEPFFSAFIAEVPEERKSSAGYTKVGMAVYFLSYSLLTNRRVIYMQLLFVMPEFRGTGVGKALLKKVAQEGVAAGCRTLKFFMRHWDKPLLDFYVSQGCHDLTSELGVHVMSCDGDALQRLGAAPEPPPAGK
ncbi:diamine acetyltransferase 1-like [Brachionichthys hirsutus]|uniref:diamine acetyltransferase 1-like n=1 Tax=Brachionichthys hirsutus TaxID=412623 RepID=UPI003604BF00